MSAASPPPPPPPPDAGRATVTASLRRLLLARSASEWTAALVLLGGVAYGLLYLLHAVFLSQLGVDAADVGIGRDRLLGGPLVGWIIVALVVALLSAVMLLVTGVFLEGHNRLTTGWQALATVAVVAVFVVPGVLTSFDEPLVSTLPVGATMAAVGFAGWRWGTVTPDPSRRWALSRLVLLTGAIVVSSLMLSAWLMASSAADAVRLGQTYDDKMFGVAMFAVQPRTLELVGSGAGLPIDARSHRDCLVHLGRDGDESVIWDVRRGTTLRTGLPRTEFVLRPLSETGMPAHCSPDPEPAEGDRVLVPAQTAEVRAGASAHGWLQSTDDGWATAVETTTGELHMPGRPADRPRPWDLASDGLRVATLDCVARRCAVETWEHPAQPVPTRRIDLPAACAVDAVAVTSRTVVVAQTGPACSARRGIWRLREDRPWERLASLGPATRVVALDAGVGGIAWAERIYKRWRVSLLRDDGTMDDVFTRDAMRGPFSTAISSVWIGTDRVRWAVSTGRSGLVRDNLVVERSLDDRSCRVVASDVPGPGRGATDALDSAVAGDQLLYVARDGLVGRPFPQGSERIACSVRVR